MANRQNGNRGGLLDAPAPPDDDTKGEAEQHPAATGRVPGTLPAESPPGGIAADKATLVSRTEGSTEIQAKPPREIRLSSDPVQRPKLVDEIKAECGEEIGSHTTMGGAAKKAREILAERYVFRNAGGHVVDAPPYLVNDLALNAGKIKRTHDEPPPRRPARSAR